jgi:hypothetical protein
MLMPQVLSLEYCVPEVAEAITRGDTLLKSRSDDQVLLNYCLHAHAAGVLAGVLCGAGGRKPC